MTEEPNDKFALMICQRCGTLENVFDCGLCGDCLEDLEEENEEWICPICGEMADAGCKHNWEE